MIKLVKRQPLPVLAAKLRQWQDQLITAIRTGQPAQTIVEHYKNKLIRDALGEETHHKCAYCESALGTTSYKYIEHIKPKSKHPELALTWENLTLACQVCNTNKSDTDDPDLINPYEDEPREHIIFAGPLASPTTDRGDLADKVFDLNRAALLQERKDKLKGIQEVILKWKNMKPGIHKDLLRRALWEEATPTKTYSAAVEDFLGNIHRVPR